MEHSHRPNSCCWLFGRVPIRNSVKFIAALTEHDISYESHIYAYGPHGFSLGNSSVLPPGTSVCSRVPQWVNDSLAWLQDMFGKFGAQSLETPVCLGHINGNHEDVLNVDCTMAYLLQNNAAKQIMEPILAQSNHDYSEYIGEEPAPDEPRMNADILYSSMTLRDILGYGGVSQDIIGQINSALKQIPNTPNT